MMLFKKRKAFTFLCAQDETRTHTILRPLPPQSSVYTNFTTCAECPEQDSNLHTLRHTHLKRTRLPIPPPGHWRVSATSCIRTKMQELVLHGAMNETRTRDPDLGKVVLYQLSYHRMSFFKLFRPLLFQKRLQNYNIFLT